MTLIVYAEKSHRIKNNNNNNHNKKSGNQSAIIAILQDTFSYIKLIVFLYTSNVQLGFEITNTISLTLTPKNEYLGITLSKYEEKLQTSDERNQRISINR